MKVLVTGGAGFIGSHIVTALASSDFEVVVLDDLSGGRRDALPAGVELVIADICEAATPDIVRGLAPEVVIHAAAQVSVARSMADPARDRAVNLAGTEHVLRGAAQAGARRFVFLSSGGAVYGETRGASEDDLPHPESYYAIHKWAAEQYVATSGMPYAIARLANVYGPSQRTDLEGGVVAIFAERLAAGEQVTIHGDGEQRRDFVHVADVASAVLAMADSERSGCWNVGTGRSTSINELLAEMEDVLGVRAERQHVESRPGDLRSSRVLVDKIRDDLGWRPLYDLRAGLAATLGVRT